MYVCACAAVGKTQAWSQISMAALSPLPTVTVILGHTVTHKCTNTRTHTVQTNNLLSPTVPPRLIWNTRSPCCWCCQPSLVGESAVCSERLFHTLSQLVQGYGDQDPALSCEDSAFLCGRGVQSVCLNVWAWVCVRVRTRVHVCFCASVCVLPFQSLKMNIGKFRLEHSEELGLKQRSLYVNNCFLI